MYCTAALKLVLCRSSNIKMSDRISNVFIGSGPVFCTEFHISDDLFQMALETANGSTREELISKIKSTQCVNKTEKLCVLFVHNTQHLKFFHKCPASRLIRSVQHCTRVQTQTLSYSQDILPNWILQTNRQDTMKIILHCPFTAHRSPTTD